MEYLGPITDSKSILNKEYGDNNYASKSETATLTENVRVATLSASESDFKAEANFRAFNNAFDYLCIECFCDTNDIDKTVDDGAYVVANFYNSATHAIEKTGSDTRTIQSVNFELEDTPYSILILCDYEGTGSISLYASKNNGVDWKSIPNDTLTSLNSLVQKNIKVKVVMTGNVTLKNIAWGCK